MTSVADIFTPTVCFVLAGLAALPAIYFRINFNEVTLRWFMDWLVNSVCVDILALSLPLFLAHTTDSKMDFILNAVAMLFVIELDDVDGLQLGNRKDFEEFMDRDENKNNPMYRLLIAQDVESGPKTKSGPADKTDADGDAAE